jgi:hypothetical protein
MSWALLIAQGLFCIAAIGAFAYAITIDPVMRNYLVSAKFPSLLT